MSQPTVCAIMLVNGRPEMVARAVKGFREQTYPAKRLLIWDTGELNRDFDSTEDGSGLIAHIPAEAYRDITIGALRNEANAFWNEYPIICHFDSDDLSHPNRIAEQVALLQSRGKQCVGYRDMLFWESEGYPKKCPQCEYGDILRLEGGGWTCRVGGCEFEGVKGQAWLYSNADTAYCLGTSLCYYRSFWEGRPFQDLPKKPGGTGEDTEFLRGADSLGDSSFVEGEPRMVATIHGGNSSYYGSDLLESSTSWSRKAEWDDRLRSLMAL